MMAHEEPEPHTNGCQRNNNCAANNREHNGPCRAFHLNLAFAQLPMYFMAACIGHISVLGHQIDIVEIVLIEKYISLEQICR